MLTPQEYEQICTAIDMSYGYNIAGDGRMVSAHNVKVLLSKFLQQEEQTTDGFTKKDSEGRKP
jgi:hypothetical protein